MYCGQLCAALISPCLASLPRAFTASQGQTISVSLQTNGAGQLYRHSEWANVYCVYMYLKAMHTNYNITLYTLCLGDVIVCDASSELLITTQAIPLLPVTIAAILQIYISKLISQQCVYTKSIIAWVTSQGTRLVQIYVSK